MRSLTLIETYASLLRWLAPWSAPAARPAHVTRRALTGAHRRHARVLAPQIHAPSGALLVCPGLDDEGPADPRLLRFVEVLAASGITVLAPFLPDFLALRVESSVAADLDLAFGALLEQPELPRGI